MARARRMSEDERSLLAMNLGFPMRSTRSIPAPHKPFLKRHKGPVLLLAAAGGAFSANRIDMMIPFYPMGEKVPPSALAFGGLILASLITNHYKKRDAAETLAALAVGVAIGGIHKAINKRQGGK